VVALVVVLVWLVALVPIALRRHSAYRVNASVARFRRQRRLLERAYRTRIDGNVFACATARASPVAARRDLPRRPSHAPISGRLRRIRVLYAFGGALTICLVLGAVPALRAFWTISIVLAVGLVAYVVLLVRVTATARSSPRRIPVGGHREVGAPDDWVSHELDADNAIHVGGVSREPWVRLLLEERSA
jgi:hypothetical protein